jgi:MFS family permease
MGLVTSAFGFASIVGPTLGGAITDQLGWRWVMFVPVPVAAVAWLVTGAVMPRVETGGGHRVDLEGSALMVTGLVALLLGFTWGGANYAWLSWQECGLFAGGAVLLVGFVWYERRAAEPLLPLDFFRDRSFSLCVVLSFLMVGMMYGALTFVPLFVQGVLGRSAQSSGLVLAPMMIGFVVGSLVVGQMVSRTGRYRVQAVVGTALVLAGFTIFGRLSPASSSRTVVLGMILVGCGMGCVMPTFSTVVQAVVPHRLLGTASSTRQLFANVGSAVAVPVFTAVVVARFQHELPRRIPGAALQLVAGSNVQPQSLLTAQTQSAVRRHFLDEPGVYRDFVAGIRGALAAGIVDAFAIGIGLAALALLLVLFLPHVELATWGEGAGERGAAATLDAVESAALATVPPDR